MTPNNWLGGCSAGSSAAKPSFSFKAAQLNPINDDLPFVVGAFEEEERRGTEKGGAAAAADIGFAAVLVRQLISGRGREGDSCD